MIAAAAAAIVATNVLLAVLLIAQAREHRADRREYGDLLESTRRALFARNVPELALLDKHQPQPRRPVQRIKVDGDDDAPPIKTERAPSIGDAIAHLTDGMVS